MKWRFRSLIYFVCASAQASFSIACSPADAWDPIAEQEPAAAIEIVTRPGEQTGLIEGDTIRVSARVIDRKGQPFITGVVTWETNASIENSDARSALLRLPGGSIHIRASIEPGQGLARLSDTLAVAVARRPDRAFLWSAQQGVAEIPPPPGASSFRPVDINDAGEVLGNAEFPGATSTRRAFIWTAAGGYVALGDFPDTPDYVEARSINDSGTVTGYTYSLGRGTLREFVWSRRSGMMRPLTAEHDATMPEAFGINNHGTITGALVFSGRPFRWDSETGLTILPIQSDCALAWDINDSGDVLGYEGTDASGFGSCYPLKHLLWDKDGRRMEISACGPGACRIEVRALNNARVVTGTRDGTAFRWSPATGFSSIGYEGADGYDINDAGDVAGALWYGEIYPMVWTIGGKTIDIPLLPGTRSGRALRINNTGQVVGTAR